MHNGLNMKRRKNREKRCREITDDAQEMYLEKRGFWGVGRRKAGLLKERRNFSAVQTMAKVHGQDQFCLNKGIGLIQETMWDDNEVTPPHLWWRCLFLLTGTAVALREVYLGHLWSSSMSCRTLLTIWLDLECWVMTQLPGDMEPLENHARWPVQLIGMG